MTLFSFKYLLIVFLVSNLLITSDSSSTFTIQITNDSRNTTLSTQCLANGERVASASIPPSGRQAFPCPMLDNNSSWATCDMSLGKYHGRFNLFDTDNGDTRICLNNACLWTVNERGLSFEYEKQLMLLQVWPTNM